LLGRACQSSTASPGRMRGGSRSLSTGQRSGAGERERLPPFSLADHAHHPFWEDRLPVHSICFRSQVRPESGTWRRIASSASWASTIGHSSRCPELWRRSSYAETESPPLANLLSRLPLPGQWRAMISRVWVPTRGKWRLGTVLGLGIMCGIAGQLACLRLKGGGGRATTRLRLCGNGGRPCSLSGSTGRSFCRIRGHRGCSESGISFCWYLTHRRCT
jgi:hypothetical protein